MLRTFLVMTYRWAVRWAPLGLERRWREQMVADFTNRFDEPRHRGPVAGVLLTLGSLLNLFSETVQRRFGSSAGAQGRVRTTTTRGMTGMESVWQDVRYAIRGIRRTPGFAAVVVVTLALAIGANTTLFSVVNGVLLTPLPYAESENLYEITLQYGVGERGEFTSYPDFVDQRRELESVESMAAISDWVPTMTADGTEAQRLNGLSVSLEFFETFRLAPSLGRVFSREDILERNSDVAVISYGLWQSAFGSDPEIVGRSIELNGRTRTIIGVGPSEFPRQLPAVGNVDLYAPMEYEAASEESETSRSSHMLQAVARLKPDVSQAAANAELQQLMASLAEQYPESNEGKSANFESLHGLIVGDVSQALIMLLGGVGLVLLIAVANVTSVLLGRATDREREMALRSALGAGRGRVYSLLMVEALILAGAGGVAGVGLAYWGTERLVVWGSRSIPLAENVSVSLPVLLATAAVAAGAGILMGLIPAWSAHRRDLHGSLKDRGTGGGTGGRAKQRLRGALVVAQVALSLTLLTGSGLLIRSLSNLADVDPGLDTTVFTFGVTIPGTRYAEWPDQEAFFVGVEERLERLPGVVEVASINGAPLSTTGICGSLFSEEDPDRFAGEDMCAEVRSVTADYFEVLDIPLLSGRTFETSDDTDGLDVIIVSRATAELLWPGENPLGKRMATGFRGTFHEVVGVVGDVKQQSMDEAQIYQTYISHLQWHSRARNLMLRMDADPVELLPAMREAVWSLDPLVPLHSVSTLDELRDRSLADERFRTLLLGAMSGLALLLSIVGIYGVISYSVSQRQREMAIRMSMGARAGAVSGMILRQAMRLVMGGLVLGALGGFLFGRALQAMLFGVEAADPATMVVVPLLLIAAATGAALVPARRATTVDPMMVLREE